MIFDIYQEYKNNFINMSYCFVFDLYPQNDVGIMHFQFDFGNR